MKAHRWGWSVVHIGLTTLLAIACCAWHWRSELSWWPAEPVIPRPFPMWQPTWNPDQISADKLQLLNRRLPPNFTCAPTLGDAVQKLNTAGAHVFVNWKAIAPTGITRDTPVSMNFGGLQFGD